MPVPTYRRRIRITTVPGKARADIEDDAHRYGVALLHNGTMVTAIRGEGLRTPWTLCIDAAKLVDRLVGMALTPDAGAIYKYTDGRFQCTHAFDVAGLAIAHAFRGTPHRQYDIDVPYPVLEPNARKTVTLLRDGRLALQWTVEGGNIITPEPYAGRSLADVVRWAKKSFTDPDDYEAVVVARRATHISGVKTQDLDTRVSAADGGQSMGRCWVFQPERAHVSWRIRGNTRDFTPSADPMLNDLEEIAPDGLGPMPEDPNQ
ncbi:MAG TPA: hypothetical protein VKB84_01260 [Candidatus Binataceae bacterium]|nr:hypothetical protein [Candidatus Binataceae bacterium]